MMIRTPSDLLGYLKALAAQHPLVASVITGDTGRSEEATLGRSRYPEVDIETPTVHSPLSDEPLTMTSRIYVMTSVGDGQHETEDIASDITYRIAKSLADSIREHSYDSEIGLSIAGQELELNPMIANGSDQKRGWMFALTVECDFGLCVDESIAVTDFTLPMFTWYNAVDTDHPTAASITFDDESRHGVGSEFTWYWQELYNQAAVTAFDPGDGIEIPAIVDGPPFLTVHVWLKAVIGSSELWAYAEIDTRVSTGRSIPFIPKLPY